MEAFKLVRISAVVRTDLKTVETSQLTALVERTYLRVLYKGQCLTEGPLLRFPSGHGLLGTRTAQPSTPIVIEPADWHLFSPAYVHEHWGLDHPLTFEITPLPEIAVTVVFDFEWDIDGEKTPVMFYSSKGQGVVPGWSPSA